MMYGSEHVIIMLFTEGSSLIIINAVLVGPCDYYPAIIARLHAVGECHNANKFLAGLKFYI